MDGEAFPLLVYEEAARSGITTPGEELPLPRRQAVAKWQINFVYGQVTCTSICHHHQEIGAREFIEAFLHIVSGHAKIYPLITGHARLGGVKESCARLGDPGWDVVVVVLPQSRGGQRLAFRQSGNTPSGRTEIQDFKRGHDRSNDM